MKRLEIPKPKDPMVVRTFDTIPSPPEGGVVIKTAFCGICHSDLHFVDDEWIIGNHDKITCEEMNPRLQYPLVLGHEISGIVHAIDGDEKDDLKVGDRVIVYPWLACNNCDFCATDFPNFCYGPSYSIGCSGSNGGYAQYVTVPKKSFVLKIPDTIPLDIACMLPCSTLTGYNAVTKVKSTIEKFIKLQGEATLLIIGTGGLGLWCLQTARASLPKGTRIICADINQSKLDNAIAHGADDCVLWDRSLSKDDIIKLTKEKGNNGSIHGVIDFVNSSTTASQAMECLCKGGAIALVGLFGGTVELSLPLFAFSLHEIYGIAIGSINQLRELIDLVANTKLIPPDITHVSLEEAPDSLIKLKKGQIAGRSLIKF
uniref:alcohol dehydrogenase-like n=1 Tax=Styela clava TaxID=7725 RepID=UPI0019392B1D|nr:alcohol dehydrogenase-like [Styela clava]